MSPVPLPDRGATVPLRAHLPRTAVLWWAAALALAGLTASVVNGALSRAEQAEQRWSHTRLVAVATAAVAAGQPLDGRVARRRLPVGAIPTGALHAVPPGRTATSAIVAGEVVVAARVSGTDAAGLAGRLAPGRRALAVPVEVAGLRLTPGDRVDLLSGAVEPGESPVVAADATVLSVAPAAVVVAVDVDESRRAAIALGRAPLLPVLAGTGG